MLVKTMNNKGFTLIEVLAVVVIIALVGMITFNTVGTTLSVSREEAYRLMKDNVVSVGYDYINECKLGSIDCNFSYLDNNTFTAGTLKNVGLFTNLESPIDGKDLSSCLILEATKSNGVIVVNLIDNCY